MYKGVSPRVDFAFAFAPWSRSSCVTLTFTMLDAWCNGVQWSLHCQFTSAPRSNNSWATRAPSSKDLYVHVDASCKEVLPMLSLASTFAPWSRSSRATSSLPYDDASCSGVTRSLRRMLTSAPRSSNSCVTRTQSSLNSHLEYETTCKGVSPPTVFASTFATWSRSSCVTLTFPTLDAWCNGVQWSSHCEFTSAPRSNNNWETKAPSSGDLLVRPDASYKGVRPIASFAFTFAPRSRSSRTTSSLPNEDARCSGVARSSRRCMLTSAPRSSNNRAIRTRSSDSHSVYETTCKGVSPSAVIAFTFAPWSRSSCVTLTFPMLVE